MAKFVKYNLNNINQLKEKPEIFFWDTGFLWMMLKPNKDDAKWYIKLSHKFYDDYLTKDNILNVTCDFVVEEIINLLISSYYNKKMEEEEQTYQKWTILHKEKPEYIKEVYPQIKTVFDFIELTPLIVYSPEKKLYDRAGSFINKYHLGAMDAFILSAMKEAGVENLITTDVVDFKRVKDGNEINIFSCFNEPNN